MTRPGGCLIAALAVSMALPTKAFAWGSDGHRIVAEIAERYLEPATARQVRELLAIENVSSLADVANWADQIRSQRRETAPWHFVDIPISAPAYKASRDCPRHECVVAKIEDFEAVLQDNGAPVQERLEALKFLVHFVGDVHQPLHAADNADHGGNDIHVEYLGRQTNLHAVWDAGILFPVVQGDDRAYALRLARTITTEDLADWRKGTVVDWANESHGIAVRMIYGDLPHQAGPLPASYEAGALPVVDRQLKRAGVRLAEELNTALH